MARCYHASDGMLTRVVCVCSTLAEKQVESLLAAKGYAGYTRSICKLLAKHGVTETEWVEKLQRMDGADVQQLVLLVDGETQLECSSAAGKEEAAVKFDSPDAPAVRKETLATRVRRVFGIH